MGQKQAGGNLRLVVLACLSFNIVSGFAPHGLRSTKLVPGAVSSPRLPPFTHGSASLSRTKRKSVLLATTEEEMPQKDKTEETLALPAPKDKTAPSAVLSGASVLSIVGTDYVLRKAFLRAGVAFPSSLAGMMMLFAGLVAMDQVYPKKAEATVGALEPGSALLARWLPVFFVPSLVVLPLSPPLSPTTAVRLAVILVAGWAVSLMSTAAVVAGLSTPSSTPPPAEPAVPPAPFTKSLIARLGLGGIAAGAAATGITTFPRVASRLLLSQGIAAPLRSLSLLLLTLGGFALGTKAPPKVLRAVHPLITCSAVAMGGVAVLARGAGVGFTEGLKAYITRSRCPVHLGAGDILLGFLGPSVLSFAVQMYRRRKLMLDNSKEVIGGSVYCSASGLFGTALAARWLGLPPALRLTVLPRNITSPLAMSICGMLGADASLAVAIVVVTGVIGANFGAAVLDAMGVKNPAARGLAQGGSAHGLGTAAMVNEPTAFAFSAVAMALTATASTVLVSIPVARKALLSVALGASSP
ncbi:unnamed protein product [Choristocarpus tenellus]